MSPLDRHAAWRRWKPRAWSSRSKSCSTVRSQDFARQLSSLLNRLSSRLGDQSVVRPRLLPDAVPERAVEYIPVTEKSACRRQPVVSRRFRAVRSSAVFVSAAEGRRGDRGGARRSAGGAFREPRALRHSAIVGAGTHRSGMVARPVCSAGLFSRRHHRRAAVLVVPATFRRAVVFAGRSFLKSKQKPERGRLARQAGGQDGRLRTVVAGIFDPCNMPNCIA